MPKFMTPMEELLNGFVPTKQGKLGTLAAIEKQNMLD
jgi:hypothetical protein